MGLYNRGSVWWMSFIVKGKRYRKSTETEDHKLAQRIYDKVKGEIAEGKWFERLPGEDKTFKEMMEKYMAEHSLPKKASSERDRSSLTHLLPFFGDHPLSEITPSHINDYKNMRRNDGASPCTVNRELAVMKHALNLAVREWEWSKGSPKIYMEKEPSSRDRWLTFEEEEKLLAVSPQWLRELIIFSMDTGCRRGEMLSLRPKDVNLFQKVVSVFGSKIGEMRSIPLPQRVYAILLEKERVRMKVRPINENLLFTHPPGKKVNVFTLRSAFERALKKAEIENFRWHDLRHTYASRLAQGGTDPYTIQRLMGHKTFSTTQRYAHHNVESLRKGVEVLDTFGGKG